MLKDKELKEVQALIDMGMKKEDAAKVKVFRGRGCKNCSNTGYRGRIALYEVMPFLDALKELVLQGASTAELKAEMIRQGLKTLRLAGITKILEGMTTPEEVLRVSVADA